MQQNLSFKQPLIDAFMGGGKELPQKIRLFVFYFIRQKRSSHRFLLPLPSVNDRSDEPKPKLGKSTRGVTKYMPRVRLPLGQSGELAMGGAGTSSARSRNGAMMDALFRWRRRAFKGPRVWHSSPCLCRPKHRFPLISGLWLAFSKNCFRFLNFEEWSP